MIRAAGAARRRRARGDAGITLIEVVVAMSILSIFLAIFTGAVTQMYRAANRTEAVAGTQSQLHVAFLRLDKEIRYAAGISTPAAVGGDQYVEFLTTNTGTPRCTQLRLRTVDEQIQRRTWTQGASPLAPSAWIPLASGVTSTQPFTFVAADTTFNFQRLRLRLTASSAPGGAGTARATDVTFTALNTSLTTSSSTVCTEGRAVA